MPTWLVKVLPGPGANTFHDEAEAREAAEMVARTDFHASELWHLDDGQWKFREYFPAAGESQPGGDR